MGQEVEEEVEALSLQILMEVDESSVEQKLRVGQIKNTLTDYHLYVAADVGDEQHHIRRLQVWFPATTKDGWCGITGEIDPELFLSGSLYDVFEYEIKTVSNNNNKLRLETTSKHVRNYNE